MKQRIWSLFLITAWQSNYVISEDDSCSGDFSPLDHAQVLVYDRGLFYVFPFYSAADRRCLARAECSFHEAGAPGAADCDTSASGDYWANLAHPALPCTDYTVLLVAHSSDGRTANRTLAFTSGAYKVTSVAVNKTSSGTTASAVVTWSSPERNSRSVTSQTVTLTRARGGAAAGTRVVSGEASEVSFQGLEPCLAYRVEVQLGVSIHLPPEAAARTFHTPSNVTGLARLSATGLQRDALLVTYSLPPASRQCVDHVHVCWESSEARHRSCADQDPASEPRLYVTGLQAGSCYTVSAAPVAADGRRYRTSVVAGRTFKCDVETVTNITVAEGADVRQATVKWSSPPQNLKCADYQLVNCSVAGTGETVLAETVPVANTSLEISGLEPCVNYTLAIQPVNWNPLLPAPATARFRTPSNVTSLSGLVVTGLSPSALRVSYTIPQVSSLCVHHFAICWAHRGTSSICTTRRGHSGTTVEVTGLAASTNYTVTVTPVAPDGTRYQSVSAVGATSAAPTDPLADAEALDLGSGLFYVFFNYDNATRRLVNHTSVCVFEARGSGSDRDCSSTSGDECVAALGSRALPCTRYSALVTAYLTSNQTASRTVNFTSGAAEVSDVSVKKSSKGSDVTVSWTSPKRNALCVSYQSVTIIRVRDDAVVGTQILSKEDNEVLFKDLELCVRYQAVVQPRTRDPKLPRATSKHFHLPSNVTSVAAVTVTSPRQDSLLVSYQLPPVSARCVGAVLVCWVTSEGNTTCSSEEGPASSSVLVSHLSPCSNYTVQVTPVAPDGRRYDSTTTLGHTSQSGDSCAGGKAGLKGRLCTVILLQALLLISSRN